MATKVILSRVDTAAAFTTANPILADGEAGWERDTRRIKIGDGVTDWNTLAYSFEETVTTLVEAPAGTFTYTSEDGTQTVFTTSGGGGGGESNTGANVGTAGVGVFKQKSGIELQFKNINTTSNKISITDDTANDEIDIDINPANIGTSELNNDANFVSEAPLDGQQYGRQNGAWTIITGGGGGPTDHGTLAGLNDDDHLQYLTEARHDLLAFDNPHNVNATQVGLGNVDNTSDADKPVSTAQQAALDLKYDASNPNGYETPLELDARDTANRSRSNHTGTQLASTISDFASAVDAAETVTSLTIDPTGTLLTFNDENGTANQIQTNVFGTEAEDFTDTSNTNINTTVPFAVRTFTTAASPTGKYRIQMEIQIEPNSASNNYEFSLRINGTQIGLELEEEGKDVGGDQRNIRVLKGYYDHIGPGTFNIELWASREGSTLVLHGVTVEKWRVS